MKKQLTILSFLILTLFVPSVLAYSVIDTAQTISYTDTFGEDSDYLINPPSYSKLDVTGNVISDSANSWSMIKDNNTGLIWENKTNDGSIHDKNKTYFWSDIQTEFIAQLNSTKFGGFSDWRLPTIKELISTINHAQLYPSVAINDNYFYNTIAASYWSSTNIAEGSSYAWTVNFNYGNPAYKYHSQEPLYVRAVRGITNESQNHFINNGNNTITDTDTNLMWSRTSSNLKMNWEDAISYSNSLSLAGYTDWRLPNQKELLSIVDYSEYMPSLDGNFSSLSEVAYWTSTTCGEEGSNSYAFRVEFGHGSGSCLNKSSSDLTYVRVVRGGQNLLPPICISWTYSDWSACQSNNTQTRTIISSSPSDCSGGNPVLTQSCEYTPPTCTSWTYSDWDACINGQQTRTITSSQPANCTGGNPILNQSCDSTPLCEENNWTSTLSPTICPSNGQQTKTWNKIGQCQEGISHPAEETVSCNYQTPTCADFTYSDWGSCGSSGTQSRTMLSSSPSGCVGGNPILNQSCTVQSTVCTSWTYSDWGSCANGWQTRTISSSSPINCINGNPVLSQSCQNETDNEDDAEIITQPETSESNPEETSTEIFDGDIIQCQNSSNPSAVYIVKIVGDTKYIRHIVSLDIFNYYKHLKWGNLKQVDSLDDYSLSGWVRYNTRPNGTAGPTDKVYEINGDQTRHWINMTAEDFLTHGGSEPAIFNVNKGELNLYTAGADVISL